MKIKNNTAVVLFILPASLMYTLFIIIPAGYNFFYSVTRWNGVSAPIFNGVANYVRIFGTRDYWRVLVNTMRLLLASVFIQVPIGMVLAYLLLHRTKGYKFFRTIMFFPVVVAPVAIGVMFSLFYNSDVGPLNQLLSAVRLGALRRNWLSDVKVVMNSVIFPQIWQYIGYSLVILFTSMKAIPQEIFESADIDGASSTQVFFSIVIPMIMDTIVIAIILVVTGSLKSFDYCWALTKGGPGNASALMSVFMYKTAFVQNQFGLGSAITMTVLVYSIGLTIIVKKIGSRV
ncbi:sugar ABC transporter permease [Spirochaetia bacterium]|nr:sugar ABC transporter permease [Spirochaetia bacterium]